MLGTLSFYSVGSRGSSGAGCPHGSLFRVRLADRGDVAPAASNPCRAVRHRPDPSGAIAASAFGHRGRRRRRTDRRDRYALPPLDRFALSPQLDGKQHPIRVRVAARTAAARARGEALLWELSNIHLCRREADPWDVLLYAVHSPEEFIGLLGPAAEPDAHGMLLDLREAVGARNAALLGVLVYLPVTVTPVKLRHGLECAAQGFSYAPEPHDGVFHHVREAHLMLSPRDKQILGCAGRGCSQEQMMAELDLPRTTLQTCIRGIKLRLELEPRVPLRVAADRLGFGTG